MIGSRHRVSMQAAAIGSEQRVSMQAAASAEAEQPRSSAAEQQSSAAVAFDASLVANEPSSYSPWR